MGPHRIHLGLVVVVVTAAGGVGACTSILGADERYEGAGGSSGTSSGETASASSSSGSSGGGATTAASSSTSGGGGEEALRVSCDPLSSSAEWSRLAPGTSRARPTYAFNKMRFAHLIGGGASIAAVEEKPPKPVGRGVKDAFLLAELGMLTLGTDGAVSRWTVEVGAGATVVPAPALGVLTEGGAPPLFAVASEEEVLMAMDTLEGGAVLATCSGILEGCEEVDLAPRCTSNDDERTFGFVDGATPGVFFWLCDEQVHTLVSGQATTMSAPGVRELAMVTGPDLHLTTSNSASVDTVELRSAEGALVLFGDSERARAPAMIRAESKIVAAWEAGGGLRLATCDTDGGALAPESCRCETVSTLGGGEPAEVVVGRDPFLAAHEETIVLGFTDERGAVDYAATLLVPTASTER